MTFRAFFAVWLSVLMSVITGLVAAASAGAVEAHPFGITKFTMQATEQTRIVPLPPGPNREEKVELENVPYGFTQAGGHPWALTTTLDFTSEEIPGVEGAVGLYPTRDPKDAVVTLPAGLLGNPVSVPRCPLTVALAGEGKCPSSTQIGAYRIRLFGGKEMVAPIVNLVPERGQSAEFALENKFHIDFLLTAHLVRTVQGYGLTVIDKNIPVVGLSRAELTFWGVPADPSHDPLRGKLCHKTRRADVGLECDERIGSEQSGETLVPFLSWPTDCAAGPEVATVRADSWEEPGRIRENQQYEGFSEESSTLPGVTGCNLMSFAPRLEVQPDTFTADEPVGLGVNIKVPQSENPAQVATPHLRKAVVTLPLGMSVSPGVVDGIQACNLSGPEGINFTGPESEEVAANGELQLAPGKCPDASIVGTAEAVTPVLATPVRGHVYLARPGCGGPGQAACTEEDALDGNLYQLYLELGGTGEFANLGVQIKVAGRTEADPATGQLTTVFDENPQTPFSELKIHLNGGPRAPIDNPAVCGQALTTADFTPWSAPGITPQGLLVAGTPDATPFSFYVVSGCPDPTPFAPGFVAGEVIPQAGQFSTLTMNISRSDREQFVKGVQVHTPPGLLGMLSSVTLCGESQAQQGTCPASSRIGTTRVATGAGSHPFEIGGSIYLTEGYGGAPFGLSIVTNAVAGPFNLGLVVVRARINVDPETSTLTVTTDETGPYKLPQIVFGIPLRLQRITVDIDRPGFMFNPTNCGMPGQPGVQQVTANISGSGQTVANVASPFAVGGCKSLSFKPRFTVSTSGHTSRANGASLDAKVTYPPYRPGSEANIASVRVALPRQLPSRLTTLQKACTAAVFAANPASCPVASVIGIVKASTPVLPVQLEGPIYFVSHGGEAFPSLVIVLQGDGVRVDLTAATFINKAGITSSTFKTIPDVPVNNFELYLPQGRTSALAANGNLCKTRGKLVMPTEFVAQNGAVLKQNTKISVSGCPKLTKVKKKKNVKRGAHGRISK